MRTQSIILRILRYILYIYIYNKKMINVIHLCWMMKLSQFKNQKIIDHHYEIELLELVNKMNIRSVLCV